MAKKQTRRSISVSGDTYNAVRDYCDKHGLSASGLVTELLEKYLVDNKDGPPQPGSTEPAVAAEPAAAQRSGPAAAEAPRPVRSSPAVRVGAPPALRGTSYPDRRGPGFGDFQSVDALPRWAVTARIEISRKRKIDAQSAVEVLLHNLVHRRLVNDAQVQRVEPHKED